MSRATSSSDAPATRSSRSKSRHPPSSADATENQHPSAPARKKARKDSGTSNGFLNPFASEPTPSPFRVSVSNSDSVPIHYGYTPHESPAELDAQTYPRVHFSQSALSRGAPNLRSSSPPQIPHASSSSVADDLSNTLPIIDPLLCNLTESPILAPRSPSRTQEMVPKSYLPCADCSIHASKKRCQFNCRFCFHTSTPSL
ncbi:hypothetical protein B0H13DRAFT_2338096 [Mycena leptocephala]|nr:hypothetical protein B0H13DRAFT_2338096 [Mycena leptocephala]